MNDFPRCVNCEVILTGNPSEHKCKETLEKSLRDAILKMIAKQRKEAGYEDS